MLASSTGTFGRSRPSSPVAVRRSRCRRGTDRADAGHRTASLGCPEFRWGSEPMMHFFETSPRPMVGLKPTSNRPWCGQPLAGTVGRLNNDNINSNKQPGMDGVERRLLSRCWLFRSIPRLSTIPSPADGGWRARVISTMMLVFLAPCRLRLGDGRETDAYPESVATHETIELTLDRGWGRRMARGEGAGGLAGWRASWDQPLTELIAPQDVWLELWWNGCCMSGAHSLD